MVTRDHYALAKALTKNLNISRRKKAAFAFGNIEPDYNRFSYMGHRSEYFSHGHSYHCRKKQIFAFMEAPCRDSLLWWYRAGKVFHYLADSFSRPHNREFAYDSKEHVKYEIELHQIFRRSLKGNPWKVTKAEPDFKSWLELRHLRYLARTRGIQDDCYYIYTTVAAAWEWMVENKLV